MEAYTDRILVQELEEIQKNEGMPQKKFKKVLIISAGNSPDGSSNKELEGKEVLFLATATGIPVKYEGNKTELNGQTVYLYRRTSIEIIL